MAQTLAEKGALVKFYLAKQIGAAKTRGFQGKGIRSIYKDRLALEYRPGRTEAGYTAESIVLSPDGLPILSGGSRKAIDSL